MAQVLLPTMDPVVLQMLSQYEGERASSGLYDGVGKAELVNGQTYDGEWVLGIMHGKGKVTFPDGIEYEGDVIDGRITGFGVYRWPNAAEYEGEILDGKRHGQGTMTFPDSGVVYEGEWRDGKRHGQGTLYFDPSRSSFYQGEWRDDMKQGHGLLQYASGNTYEGDWLADQKTGQGTMRWHDTAERYTGEWLNSAPHGLGEHIWWQPHPPTATQAAQEQHLQPPPPPPPPPQQQQQQQQEPTATAAVAPAAGAVAGTVVEDALRAQHAQIQMCNRYFGQFSHGRRHGEGTLCYATGARYEGQWVADLKHGEGVYVLEDGTVFSGRFERDRAVADAEGAPISHISAVSTSGSASTLQLYISDLLVEELQPEVVARVIGNLLTCHNQDLRALYSTYSHRPTAHAPPDPERSSFALLVGQFWQLARERRLCDRSTPLVVINRLLAQARRPPETVLRRRERVRRAGRGGAVLRDNAPLHSPAGELLFRDFAEALVRIAHHRFYDVESLDQRLQLLIKQHVVLQPPATLAQAASTPRLYSGGSGRTSIAGQAPPPVVAAPSGRTSSAGQQLIHAQQPPPSGKEAPRNDTVAGCSASPVDNSAIQQVLLDCQVQLQRLFVSIAHRDPDASTVEADPTAAAASADVGNGGSGCISDNDGNATGTTPRPLDCFAAITTPRAVLQLLQRAAMMPAGLSAADAANLVCTSYAGHEQGDREEEKEEDASPLPGSQDAAAAALLRMDEPVTYAEFVEALVACAAATPSAAPPAAPAEMRADEAGQALSGDTPTAPNVNDSVAGGDQADSAEHMKRLDVARGLSCYLSELFLRGLDGQDGQMSSS